MEYHIWCDESIKKGEFFSNFYGGLLVRSGDLEYVKTTLEKAKVDLNLLQELKWTKVTRNYLEKYMAFVDVLFELILADMVKVRIFFTQNNTRPTALTSEHRQNEFFILYYQFFKHIFGFQFSNPDNTVKTIRLHFDKLPDKKEKVDRFKDFISELDTWSEFRENRIRIQKRYISEIDSKEHVLLQSLDLILGAMAFKLNRVDQNFVKISPKGRKIRGKKTIAKEKLYKHIQSHIRRTRENFNIGVSTGVDGDISNRWNHVYRHWRFESSHSEANEEYRTKKMP